MRLAMRNIYFVQPPTPSPTIYFLSRSSARWRRVTSELPNKHTLAYRSQRLPPIVQLSFVYHV